MFGAHLDGVVGRPGHQRQRLRLGDAARDRADPGRARTRPCSTTSGSPSGPTRSRGSTAREFYANTLPTAERTKIKGYFNFDMVASTNGGYFINRITVAHRPGAARPTTTRSACQHRGERRGRRPLRRRLVQRGRHPDQRRRRRRQRQQDLGPGRQVGRHDRSTTTRATTRRATRTRRNISDTVLNRAGDAAAYALWTLATGTPRRPRSTRTPSRPPPAGPPTPTAPTPPPPASWERGDPAATTSSGAKQLGTTVSGVNDLVTGRLAGTGAGDYDIDGGITSDPLTRRSPCPPPAR